MDANFWGQLIGGAIGAAIAAYKAISIIGDKLAKATAAQSTVLEIKEEVEQIKLDLAIVKKATARPMSIDDRSPK